MRRLLHPLRRRIRILLAIATVTLPAMAAEVTDFTLDRQDGGYRMHVRAMIDAPREAVRRVLTDYAASKQVSPRIIESDLVAVSSDGVARVRTLNRLCFLFFCRDLRQVQLIRELGRGEFESHSVPEESDLSYGRAHWRLSGEDGHTVLEIDFSFAMESYSWVPHWVSRLVARSVLKADAAEMVQGIERTARRQQAGADGT